MSEKAPVLNIAHQNNGRGYSVRGLLADPAIMSTGNAAVVPTDPLHGYQVIFSPYSSRKLAFTGSNNYGIAGEETACHAYDPSDMIDLQIQTYTMLCFRQGGLDPL